MKIRKIALLSVLLVSVSSFTGCTSVSTLTGDKLVKQSTSNLTIQSNVDMTDININTQIPGEVKAQIETANAQLNVKAGELVSTGMPAFIDFGKWCDNKYEGNSIET